MVESIHNDSGQAVAEGNGWNRGSETRALRMALMVTVTTLVAEFAGGLWTNSLALLADAGHMLSDAAALGLSLFAIWFSKRPATPENTYGFFRVEILAALANGTALLLIAVWIVVESYQRFANPPQVRSLEMLLIAVVGLAANLICVWLLHADHQHNLNVRGAFLHVLGDVLGSVAAIAAALSMVLWKVFWADPLVSVLVSLLICYSAARLVKDSVQILLEGTPSHVSVAALKAALCRVPGVKSVHDLHVWTLTSGMHAMTCHAVVMSNYNPEIIRKMSQVSREEFDVCHTTIQIEVEHMCRNLDQVCN